MSEHNLAIFGVQFAIFGVQLFRMYNIREQLCNIGGAALQGLAISKCSFAIFGVQLCRTFSIKTQLSKV